jgi:hypothetical protein
MIRIKVSKYGLNWKFKVRVSNYGLKWKFESKV